MHQLTLFEAFFITHFIVDWIFQWKWESTNKDKKLLPLLFHCFVYTIGFIPVFLIYEINSYWLALLFVSHALLDQRGLEIWILEKFKGLKKEGEFESFYNIVLIGIDQTLHIVVLAFIVILS